LSWPAPQPGLVIRYSYLWASEALQGREEGVKDRPCAIILVTTDLENRLRVQVLPVTHTPRLDPSAAIEMPDTTKQRLGLDDARSWVVLSESNEFSWPGPDLRPAVRGDLQSVAIGWLPPGLFRTIRERYLALDKQRKTVPRTE
jgi:hypothetical protein